MRIVGLNPPRAGGKICLFVSLTLFLCGAACGTGRPPGSAANELARLRPDVITRNTQGGWKYDAHPELQSLDAGTTITLAEIPGPAQINTIHLTQMDLHLVEEGAANDTARGVVLEIFFDGTELPAVSVPLGDFFADGTGEAADFSTPFIEKAPGSYNCYIPMPFQRSARVTLRNDLERNLTNYIYIEWQTLPQWETDLGYFHAAWSRSSFALGPDTTWEVYRLRGPGHLIGEYRNLRTDEPLFAGLMFVMEGNNQYQADGEAEASIQYLGSEDSFNFSWGWRGLFNGRKIGINQIVNKKGEETALSTYRFRDRDVIRFGDDLRLTIDWTSEFRGLPQVHDFLEKVRKRKQEGGNWVEYAVTTYWYAADPAGAGVTLPAVEERLQPLLHPNPAAGL